jgi:hypothetical protein
LLTSNPELMWTGDMIGTTLSPWKERESSTYQAAGAHLLLYAKKQAGSNWQEEQ